MKITASTAFTALSLLSATLAMAGSGTISVTPYQKPSGLLTDRNFRFLQTETMVADAQNSATHILIEGLLPVDPATPAVVSSAYTAINISTGAEQDAGYVIMELPQSTPEPGVVTSPVVGIVSRAGAWNSFSPTPVATSVGNSNGQGTYDGQAGTLSISLNQAGGKTITGSASYTIVDGETVQVQPFTLTVNSEQFPFLATTLKRSGTSYTGVLEASTPPPLQYVPDSLMFFLSMIDTTDADTDGLPDFSDAVINGPQTDWDTGATSLGSDSFDLPWFGKYTTYGAHNQNWLFLWEHGFVWVYGMAPNSIFLYTLDMDWMWTGQGTYPFMYRFASGAGYWMVYYQGTGSSTTPRWFYNYSTNATESHPLSGFGG